MLNLTHAARVARERRQAFVYTVGHSHALRLRAPLPVDTAHNHFIWAVSTTTVALVALPLWQATKLARLPGQWAQLTDLSAPVVQRAKPEFVAIPATIHGKSLQLAVGRINDER